MNNATKLIFLLSLSLMVPLVGCEKESPSPAAMVVEAEEEAGDEKPEEAEKIEEADFDYLQEAVGPLRIGHSGAKVVEALGEPPQRSEEVEEGATGDFVSQWTYTETGVELGMASETAGAEKSIRSITILEPSKFATTRGIHVGSTRGEVEEAYGHVEDADSAGDETIFVAGSLYGGIVFSFEEGRVTRIFIGAAAE